MENERTFVYNGEKDFEVTSYESENRQAAVFQAKYFMC